MAVLASRHPSSAKRHLADLRARLDLTTEQLIDRGRAEGWLVVPSLERLSLTWDARLPRNGVANLAKPGGQQLVKFARGW